MRLLILLSLLLTTSVSAQKIKVCLLSSQAHPFINSEEQFKLGNKGILTSAVELAAANQQIAISFVRIPWKRCLRDIKTNQVNAVLGIIKTPVRELQYSFPTNENWYLVRASYPLFIATGGHLSEPRILRQLADHPNGFNREYYLTLKRFGISAPAGFVVYNKLLNDNLLEQDYAPEEGLRQLANGRLDAYVIDSIIGNSLINKLGLGDKIKQTDIIILQENWHIAFNQKFYKSHQQMVEQFWQDASVHSKLLTQQYTINNE